MDLVKTKNELDFPDGQSPAEKKKLLFLRQKALLDTFLAHNAITKAQYEKSLGDLRVKMGMTGVA